MKNLLTFFRTLSLPLPSSGRSALLFAALPAALLCGQVAKGATPASTPAPQSAEMTPGARPAPADTVPGSDYRIVPNDQIRFHVTGELDEVLIHRVSSQGEIAIPLLGAVKVAGLTLRESGEPGRENCTATAASIHQPAGHFYSPLTPTRPGTFPCSAR